MTHIIKCGFGITTTSACHIPFMYLSEENTAANKMKIIQYFYKLDHLLPFRVIPSDSFI